jgi:hypothetical protein
MRLRRISTALALLASAALLLPAAGDAASPQKGARYSGTIAVQEFPEQTLQFPLSFTVDPTGHEIGAISFPHGAPFGLKCEQGPLGEPASAGRHATIEGSGIDVTFPLEFLFEGAETSGQPELGTVHLQGTFRPHGIFAGELQNRTKVKVCRGSWTFKLHAQSR